jgi:hypothetical protein
VVVVEFRRPERDEQGRAIGFRAVTRLTVRDGDVQVEGEEPEVDLGQRVVSLRTGRTITFGDDPEEWARSLAASYRTPYLWAEVVEDTNPLPEVEVEPVQVREPVVR